MLSGIKNMVNNDTEYKITMNWLNRFKQDVNTRLSNNEISNDINTKTLNKAYIDACNSMIEELQYEVDIYESKIQPEDNNNND